MSASRLIACIGLVIVLASGSVIGDGMIVPVRPELPVRGQWSVKYHHVDVTVRDQVASVHIDQEFINQGAGVLEVEYLFPVPPDAAIDSMTLLVNGKEFAARLLKAEEARKVYEDIVRRKKDPALLEYAGFGLYRTSAFPLEPGKPCRVIVTYKSICKKDGDLVEVWYPLNTEKFSAKTIDDVTVNVDVKTDADITAVYSPSHDLTVERKGPRQAVATFHAKDSLPTTDFVMYYKAADEKVGATLLTCQDGPDKDGYFMLLVSPNPRSAAASVVAKDIVFVLDRSGSMSGKKIKQACEALRHVVNNLNGEDRFSVITYSDEVTPLFDKLVAGNEANVKEALDRIDRIEATGGTNIHEALQTALKMLGDKDERRPQYIIFLTDGRPTVGKRDEGEIVKDTQAANAAGARLFAFGVGYDVNVRLIDRLVEGNHGRSGYIKENEPVETKISALYNKIKNPVMTGIEASVQDLRLRDVYPRQIGDLFEGDQIVLVGRYLCEDARKLPSREVGVAQSTLLVKGTYEGKEKAFEYPVTLRPGDKRYGFVEKLWAMRRVGFLLDEIQLHGKSDEVIDEIVRLSREYGIMTPYTSFLADETETLAKAGGDRRMRGMARDEAQKLARSAGGAEGHIAAETRGQLGLADRLPSAAAPPAGRGGAAPGPADVPGKGIYTGLVVGHKDKAGYEAGETEAAVNLRDVGGVPLYRRGRLWATSDTVAMDLDKEADKIKTVERFSDEYFKLVAANTVEENRILSSQQEGEELLINLRGQVYRIK